MRFKITCCWVVCYCLQLGCGETGDRLPHDLPEGDGASEQPKGSAPGAGVGGAAPSPAGDGGSSLETGGATSTSGAGSPVSGGTSTGTANLGGGADSSVNGGMSTGLGTAGNVGVSGERGIGTAAGGEASSTGEAAAGSGAGTGGSIAGSEGGLAAGGMRTSGGEASAGAVPSSGGGNDGPPGGTGSTSACGDGELRAPEECDDHGVSSGDGCSSDCRIERLEWVTTIAGSDPFVSWMPLGGGRIAAFTNRGVTADQELSPKLWYIEADGAQLFSRDFGLARGSTFLTALTHVSDDDGVQLLVILKGEARELGNTGGRQRAYLCNYDQAGLPRSAAPLSVDWVSLRYFTRKGDFVAGDVFAGDQSVRLHNATASYPNSPGRSFWLLRVGPDFANEYVDDKSLGIAFSAETPPDPNGLAPQIVTLRANDTQQAVLLRSQATALYLGGQRFTLGGEGQLAVIDRKGALAWTYNFESVIGEGKLEFLSDGDLVADINLLTEAGNDVRVEDATGPQRLGRHAVFRFAADGSLRLARGGRYLAEDRDGALVIHHTFVGEVNLEQNTPNAQTLSSATTGTAWYVAAYSRSGELQSAEVLAAWSTEVEPPKGVVTGPRDFVLVMGCDPETRFGRDGAIALALPAYTEASCLLRGAFDGSLSWVVPTTLSPAFEWSSKLALDGDRLWLGDGFAASPDAFVASLGNVTRLDAEGEPDFALELGSPVRQVLARDGNVWVTTDVRAPLGATIAPGDPLATKVSGDADELVVVKLRDL